jgi:hypothetical protein
MPEVSTITVSALRRASLVDEAPGADHDIQQAADRGRGADEGERGRAPVGGSVGGILGEGETDGSGRADLGLADIGIDETDPAPAGESGAHELLCERRLAGIRRAEEEDEAGIGKGGVDGLLPLRRMLANVHGGAIDELTNVRDDCSVTPVAATDRREPGGPPNRSCRRRPFSHLLLRGPVEVVVQVQRGVRWEPSSLLVGHAIPDLNELLPHGLSRHRSSEPLFQQ